MTTIHFMVTRRIIAMVILTAGVLLASCSKDDVRVNESNQPSSYSSNVLDKWMTMEIRLMRNATGIPNHAFSRHYVYAGIAALQSLAPGLPAHASWSEKFNGLTGLPQADHSVKYYYPANVNGAMATIIRSMFPNASAADKISVDSLENALNQEFLTTQSASLIETSANFGKATANAVFTWAQSDGHQNANNSYSLPVGPGKWVPTAPTFANPLTPHWGANTQSREAFPIHSQELLLPFLQMLILHFTRW
jgi:hypothetical protein